MAPNFFTSAKNAINGLNKKTIATITLLAPLLIIALGLVVGLIRFPLAIQISIAILAGLLPVIPLWWFSLHLESCTKSYEKTTLMIGRSRKRIDYLESIIQDSSDIIFTVDTDGYILKFNKGSEQYFGYSQAEIVGKPLIQLFANEADERKILSAVLLSGKSTNEEVPMKTQEGAIILLNLSMSEMKNDSSEIIGLVVTAKDITEKKKLELELRRKNELLSKLAITDSLTSLYNLRHFYDQINRELRRLWRNPNHKLSLILLDIDHFKQLNDTEGHQVGDQVLKSLAQVIKVCIRKDIDSGYRYGGDEFVLILPDTDKVQAKVVADRIQKQFSAFKFGQTSLSIGISEALPADDEKILVKRADEAMYSSKRGGRARITLA